MYFFIFCCKYNILWLACFVSLFCVVFWRNYVLKSLHNIYIADGSTKLQNIFNNKGTNSYVKSSVSNTGSKDIYMGGIVGLTQANVTVKNCLNEVAVTNTGKISSGNGLFVGGIAGYLYSAVSGCGNTGDISGGNTSVNSSYVGGIVGYSQNTITDCFNRGSVTATAKESNSSSTGLSAKSRSELFNVESGFLKKKYVMYGSTSISSEGKAKYAYAGGMAGYCNKSITRAYSTGTITGGGTYLKTVLTYTFEIDKYAKNFWGNYKHEADLATRSEPITALRCKPYAAPLNGNTDNTSETTTYYYGTVQTSINGNTFVEAWGSSGNKVVDNSSQYMNNAPTYTSLGWDGKLHGYMREAEYVYWCGISNTGYVSAGIGVDPSTTAICTNISTHKYADKNTYSTTIAVNDTKYSTTIKTKKSSSISSLNMGTNWTKDSTKNGGYPFIGAIYW